MRLSWHFRLWWGDPAEHRIRGIRRNVFGFSALEYVKKPFTVGFFSGINLDGSSCRLCTGLGLSEKSGGRRNSGFLGSLFLCGSELLCFGFSTWNPQWVF